MKGLWRAWEKIMDPTNYKENFEEDEYPEDKMDKPKISVDLLNDKITTYCYEGMTDHLETCDIFVDITDQIEFWLGADRSNWQFSHWKDWVLTITDWEKQKLIEKHPGLKGVITCPR